MKHLKKVTKPAVADNWYDEIVTFFEDLFGKNDE